MELKPRQEEILNSVIKTHIETALPVGSSHLRERCHMRYSSATVRNIMGNLEDAGYLTHTHTSSGRIPTDLGYRYYVNNCMNQTEVRRESGLDRFQNDLLELSGDHEEPERFVEEASRLIASILRETSLIFLSGRGHLSERTRVYLQGSAHILDKPEFQDINKVKILFQVFEEKTKLVEIITGNSSADSDLVIRIGHENSSEVFHDCSIISTRYYAGGKKAGNIAVVGPKRMNYDFAVPFLSQMAEMIGDVLDERF